MMIRVTKTEKEKSNKNSKKKAEREGGRWGIMESKTSLFSLYFNFTLPALNLFFRLSVVECLFVLWFSDWSVSWILWHINLCRLFNAKYIFM